MYRGTFAVVDKDAIAANVTSIKSLLAERVRMLVTVKANGYGHGAIEAARAAIRGGATDLGVASVEEGKRLREAGIAQPILVLGAVTPAGAAAAAEAGLAVGVSTQWDDLPEGVFNPPLQVHVKVDTGMGRLGLRDTADVVRLIRSLKERTDVRVTGLFTHLACADAKDTAHSGEQIRRFTEMLAVLRREGLNPPLIHVANSAATLRMQDWHYGMVRVGIAAYGYPPSDAFDIPVSLSPALNLYSFITRIDTLAPGETVGYGATFTACRPTRVATLPVGYADGYFRILSNRAHVVVGGREAPVIGNVCMDQMMIDVTHLPEAETGDCVTLYGHHAPAEWKTRRLETMTEDEQFRWLAASYRESAQSSPTLSLDVLARLADTISYELMCALAVRVPRIYVDSDSSF